MSPLALLLLRRATGYALIFAVLLWAAPKILTTFGILGPSLDEEIQSAERSLLAAKSYGATEQDPSYARGLAALQRARAAAARNDRWPARSAIAEARESATDAQRTALATREESRKAAQKIVAEIDRSLNELEDLFGDARKGVDKKEADRLFSLMKSTRQRSAALVLFFEEQSYGKVVAGEREVKDVMAATRHELLAARGARTRP